MKTHTQKKASLDVPAMSTHCESFQTRVSVSLVLSWMCLQMHSGLGTIL